MENTEFSNKGELHTQNRENEEHYFDNISDDARLPVPIFPQILDENVGQILTTYDEELTISSDELTPPPTQLTPSMEQLTPPPTELTNSSEQLTPPPTELTNSREQLTSSPTEITNNSDELTPQPTELTNEEQLLKNDVKKASSKGITQKPVGIYIDIFNDVLKTVEEGGMTMLGYCSEILSHHREIFTIEQVKLDLVAEKEEALKLKETVFQKEGQISNLEGHIKDLNKLIEDKDAEIEALNKKINDIKEGILLTESNVPADTMTVSEHLGILANVRKTLTDIFQKNSDESDECYQHAIAYACNDLFVALESLSWNESVESAAELQKTFAGFFIKHFESKQAEIQLLKTQKQQ